MNLNERNMMIGMVNILNEASKRPILTEEQYTERLFDLKQFEEETNFILLNSPSCKDKIGSVVKVENIFKDNYKKYHDVKSIIKFAENKEMLAHPKLIGNNVEIVYVDGVMTNMVLCNPIANLKEIKNIPYKINKHGLYVVHGVLHNLDFYVTDVIDGGYDYINKNLKELIELGFDVVQHFAVNLNSRVLKDIIDYIFDYLKEEELICDGIVFKFNDVSCGNDGIVYEMLK